MKAAAAVILMLLFSVQTFSKWMWVLDYQLNKTYIAQNLCINKTKPALHCNGKCQLTKKLAEDESRSKNSGTATANEETGIPFLTHDFVLLPLTWSEPVPNRNARYLIKKYTSLHAAVFHPPAV